MGKDILARIMKGIAGSRAVSMGANLLGKGANVFGYGLGAYSSVQAYRGCLKNDPSNTQVSLLEEEIKKWNKAVEFIGNKPYIAGDRCEIRDPTAINLHGKTELYHDGCSRYVDIDKPFNKEYHIPFGDGLVSKVKGVFSGNEIVNPDPAKSKRFITRAVEYIKTTNNELDQKDFDSQRDDVIERLRKIHDQLGSQYNLFFDYNPIQEQLFEVVEDIYNLKLQYASEIGSIGEGKKKRMAKYIGVAAGSFVLGNLAPKSKKTKKK